jgi:hypothetical protein
MPFVQGGLTKVLGMVKLPPVDPVKAVVGVGVSAAIVGGVFKFVPEANARWVILVGLAGVVALVVVVRWLFSVRDRAKARSLYETLDSTHRQAIEASAVDEREGVLKIHQRFRDAVDELKHARKTIYDLPWILLIGEPKSGKSTVLRGSELHFPVGAEKLSGLGGTRNCDWFFTNEAVVLDTAGRFAFPEEGSSDRAEWQALLELLSRKRRNCPINGVIVVVPADALLKDPPEQRKEKAKNIHVRLGELQRKLGVQFPVFLVITKCDFVLGFSETFREFGAVQAAQLVGWSNDGPFDQPYDHDRFERDFDAVYRRLSLRRLELLRRAAPIEERGLIYSFPEGFRALGPALQQYLSVVFAPDIYHDPLFFRGFYFTSGLQEGKAITDVLKKALAGGRVGRDTDDESDVLGKLFEPRPFFCEDLFKAKALRETRMVFRSSAEIRGGRRRKHWTYVGGLALTLGLATVLTIGMFRVNQLVTQPKADAKCAVELTKGPALGSADSSNACDAVFGKDNTEPSVRAAKLLDKLDLDINNLRGSPWLLWLTFPFRNLSTPAAKLQERHDDVCALRVLRPMTTQLAERLSNADNWGVDSAKGLVDEKTFDHYRTSALEFVKWYAGAVGNNEKSPADPLNRLLRPLREDTWSGAREHFAHLHPDAVAKLLHDALPENCGDTGGAMQGVIAGAKEAFMRRYAGEKGEDLGPWVEMLDQCDNVRDQYQSLLGLADEFENARCIDDYNEARSKWTAHYAQNGTEAPLGFKIALENVRADVEALNRRLKATEQVSESWRAPTLQAVSEPWRTFFGTSDDSGGLREHLSVPSVGEAERARFQDSLRIAVKDLNDRAQSVIENRILARLTRSDALVKAGKLLNGTDDVESCLAAMNARLTETRDPSIGKYLDSWVSDLSLKDAVAPPTSPTETCKLQGDDSRSWKPSQLSGLNSSVRGAEERHTRYVNLIEAEGRLRRSDNAAEIETLRPDARKALEKDTVGWESLEHRYKREFLLDTLSQVEVLQTALTKCTQNKCCLCGPPAGTTGNEPPLDPDVAHRVYDALENGVEAYAKRYFEEWGRIYASEVLDGYKDLTDTSQWSDYYDAITADGKNKIAKDLPKQAATQLVTFIESVLTVDDPEAPASSQNKGAPDDLRRRHLRRVSEARHSLGEMGIRFSGLKDLLPGWNDERRGGSEPSGTTKPVRTEASLGRAVEEAVTDLRNSARSIRGDLSKSSGARQQIKDLNSKEIENLHKLFPRERILKQLNNIALSGRYALNLEIDERLDKLLSDKWKRGSWGTDLSTVFPFTRPNIDKEDPPALKPEEMAGFLRDMTQFEIVYDKVSEPGELGEAIEKWAPSVGRHQFIERCRRWRRFIYGGAGKASSAEGPARDESIENLATNNPQGVFFTVQYAEPKGPSPGRSYYLHGALSLGWEHGTDTGKPRKPGTPIQIDFNQTKSPLDPVSRVWQLGTTKSEVVSLTLTDVHSLSVDKLPSVYDVSEVTLKQVDWALPMFIYRFMSSDDSANVKPGTGGSEHPRTRWYVPVAIKVTPQGQPPVQVSATFVVTINLCGNSADCELPPPIGWFVSTIRPPNLSLD